MSVWDYIGNAQKSWGNNVETDAVPAKNGRVPFGVTLDATKTLPNNMTVTRTQSARLAATASNASVEKARKAFLNVAAIPLKVLNVPIAAADRATKGGLGKVLTYGQNTVRSNYAFLRGAADDGVGTGLFAGITALSGAVGGALAGAATGALVGGVGAIPGAIAGAVVGYNTAGAGMRSAAKAGNLDFINKKLKADAQIAETAVGQEHYNFGRDVVRKTAQVTGWKTLGDTSTGIGAVTSGLLNFASEVALDPTLKVAGVAGKAGKSALIGGVVPKSQGIVVDTLNRTTGIGAKERAAVLADDIEVIKKTAAGETTKYTPLFDFIKKNDAATINNHPVFKNNDMGQVAAGILAGASDEQIGLVLRIGRGDVEAVAELANKHVDTFAELVRYESGLAALSEDGMVWFKHKYDPVYMVGKKYRDAEQLIKDELEVLRAKHDFVEKATSLEAWMQTDRTVSIFPWVERLRADNAVRNTAVKLSGTPSKSQLVKDIKQDTVVGKAITSVFQKSGLSTAIHWVDRAVDDVPHLSVNFNEGIQSATRMRSNLRLASRIGALPEIQALDIFNKFISAKDEGAKLAIIEGYAESAIRNIAAKYGHHESLADLVVDRYIKEHRLIKGAAQKAKEENRAYMVGKDGSAIGDPQLITQLANGAYMPDIALIDKAFKEFGKSRGKIAKGAALTAYTAKTALDELNGIWRTGTLLRAGFTANILRDATFRGWADASMFSTFKNLSIETLDYMSNSSNTVGKIKDLVEGATNPKQNLKNVTRAIKEHDEVLATMENALKDMGYNAAKPPKEISPTLARAIEQRDKLKATADELRRQEAAIIAKVPSKTIQRDKHTVAGWEFPAAKSGALGELSREKLSGRENFRAAAASLRELEMESVRRGNYGGEVLHAVDNEATHLSAWVDMLNNHLRNDPLAVKIMEGKMQEWEIKEWLRQPKQYSYIDRFGITTVAKGEKPRKLTTQDVQYIYDRVNDAVESIAANAEVRQLVLENKLTAVELKRLYPKVEERPPVAGDVITTALGRSNIARKLNNLAKDGVTWMATQPTARLNYNHYFASKYYEKLETLVLNANERGILPDAERVAQYEKIARSYAMNEYRSKINSFSKDMNFAGIANYFLAFFPAVVEQFRAYGRIMLDNPEFPIRVAYAAQIPQYMGEVKKDSYGNNYLEVTLPFFGVKARFNTNWANPVNPTGGTILGPGPALTTAANFAAKYKDFSETAYGNFLLPFGAQTNMYSAYTPNTINKGFALFRAAFVKNGAQFEKDTLMLAMQGRADFSEKHGGRQPSNKELLKIQNEAERHALYLSILRFSSALTMPAQPRLTTAITYYQDEFNKAIQADPVNGAADFMAKNPEFFMVGDKLTNSVSGINPDKTSVTLAKKHSDVLKLMTGEIKDLTALGAVFNDANFAFSSSAEAYLRTTNIPGLQTKFKESKDSLEASRASIVNKGWSDWFKLIEVVSTEIKKPPYNLDPNRGYGAVVLQQYKDAFIEQQKTENNMWYKVKVGQSGGGADKTHDVVNAITVAANNPKMWKDLAQQPRWHAIVEYMNFRYQIFDELKRRGTSYGTTAAADLREQVLAKVGELRTKDVSFGQFYDRYFDGDKFDYVYGEGN